VPMLTKVEVRSRFLVQVHFWFWMIGSVVMAYAGGMAGAQGMLRRTIYEGGQYQSYLLGMLIGSLLVAGGFVAFLINIIATLGWRNVLGLALPERWLGRGAAAAEV